MEGSATIAHLDLEIPEQHVRADDDLLLAPDLLPPVAPPDQPVGDRGHAIRGHVVLALRRTRVRRRDVPVHNRGFGAGGDGAVFEVGVLFYGMKD